ncbi:MAG: hypothetical protein GXP45_00385 [bacterium]|nr:hypothetical protein [bacterium]
MSFNIINGIVLIKTKDNNILRLPLEQLNFKTFWNMEVNTSQRERRG